MAEILDGSSEHATFAPLSQAQTIAICKHLQTEIRQVHVQLGETQRELQHVSERLDTLRDKQGNSHEDVHQLQLGLADTNTTMSKMQSELERNIKSTMELMLSDQTMQDKIIQLEEGKKIIDGRLDQVFTESLQTKEGHQVLKDDVDRRINKELHELRKQRDNTNLSLEQLRVEQAQTAEAEKEDRTSLREAHIKVEGVLNEVKKANTVTSILENRLASTAKGVQQNWQKCAELADGAVKLNECYEKTRARVVDCEGQIKEVRDANVRTHHEVENIQRQVEHNTSRLENALSSLDDEGNATEEMRHQINALRQGSDNANRRIAAIQQELQRVAETTQQVRAGLKEQSSLLLPNINMDSPEAASASARHGSLLAGGNGSSSFRSQSRNSPSGSKSQKAWM